MLLLNHFTVTFNGLLSGSEIVAEQFKSDEVVVVNVSGRGDKDLATYLKHMKDE